MSIIKGARNMKEAKVFADWALSPAAQTLVFNSGQSLQVVNDMGDQIVGRKLLGEEARSMREHQAELRKQLKETETTFYQELVVLHEIFNTGADGFKPSVTTQLGVASAIVRGEAALGGNTFEDVFEAFRAHLTSAFRAVAKNAPAAVASFQL